LEGTFVVAKRIGLKNRSKLTQAHCIPFFYAKACVLKMSALLAIKAQKSVFLGSLEALKSEAQASAGTVAKACANIQRVYRGRVDRARILFKSNHVTTIQRVFRGMMGRMRSYGEKSNKNELRMHSFFTYFAIQMQRYYRGYYSRKYRSNHADRKKFIGDLEETGRKVRQMMYEYSKNQAIREEKDERLRQAKDFESYASNLHHLVSTKQIRGVFNPPEEYMETPTWRDQPVETHVRKTIKDLLRTRGIAKTGLIVDMNGTRKVPLKGLKSRLSLQASAPYDMLSDDKKRSHHLHKILTRDKGVFFAGGKTAIINKGSKPLSTGDEYVDANLNPLLKKGVPESQRQLLESARTQKALFDPPLERPFYSRTGGNQSSIHNNDLFDVIGDALQSGGVTNRALGTSARFGVSDNCDNRPPGGILPEPPIRASTLRVSRPRQTKVILKAKPMSGTSRLDSLGLTGVAKYDKGGGGAPESNGFDYEGDGGEEWVSPIPDDEGNIIQGHAVNSNGNRQFADPYASSDEED
jgi:hypothetical protein